MNGAQQPGTPRLSSRDERWLSKIGEAFGYCTVRRVNVSLYEDHADDPARQTNRSDENSFYHKNVSIPIFFVVPE